jgi:hypothetical protein
VTEDAQYSTAEVETIRRAFTATGKAVCPRCAVELTSRPIGGGSFGLGYARQREWLLCPRCRRSALFDVRRGTRT